MGGILPLAALPCLLFLGGQVIQPTYGATLDPNNHFIFPGLPGPARAFQDNLNFTVGTVLSTPFTWITDMTSYSLQLIQEAPPTVSIQEELQSCDDNPQFLYWEGYIGSINLSVSNIAFLGVYNCSPDATYHNIVFTSHYFNLIEADTGTASAVPSNTILTSTTVSPTGSVSQTQAGTPSSPTSSPVATSSPQLSNDSVAIGAGVGGGVGGAILIVGLAAVFWRRRSKGQTSQTGHSTSSDATEKTLHTDGYQSPAIPPFLPFNPQDYSSSYQTPSELSGNVGATQHRG